MKKKIPFKHYLEYYVMLLLQVTIRFTHLKMVLYTAKYLAKILTFFVKFRNSIVISNLKQAFPDYSEKKLFQIRDEMYQDILMSSFESYKYMFFSNKQKLSKLLVSDEDKAILLDYKEQNHGCIVVGGHFGFFEGAGHFATAFGIKSAFVVANQKNKLTGKLIDEPRERAGIMVIHRKKMMQLLRAFKDNYFVALLSDQDSGKRGVMVDFFGKEAATHKNAGTLALKKNIPLLLVSVIRDKKDITIHHIRFKKIDTEDIKIKDISFDDKVKEIVAKFTKMLEEEIRENPNHYWWLHKRYKTRKVI